MAFKDRLAKYFRIAIDNIVEYGDTDIFPFPVETHLFRDEKEKIVELLLNLYDNFDKMFVENPPAHISTLAAAGYTGFRWATQMDPLWNAYLLGIVLLISDDIENYRLATERNSVFSYRLKVEKGKSAIFDQSIGWKSFMDTSVEKAKNSKFVLICDISDCYQRIYHHRLENSLDQCSSQTAINSQIIKIISHYAHPKSYGLPIGGPAARILCELVLNFTDHTLASSKIDFCRFADDYHIFCDNMDDAYNKLIFISEKLLKLDGLALQKSKTRIVPSEEFVSNTNFTLTDPSSGAASIMRLSLRFDPYSANAEEEYEELKKEVGKHDIIGLLNAEIGKQRVHGAVTKRLVQAIKYLEPPVQNLSIKTLYDNLDVLLPIFSTISIMTHSIFNEIDHDTRMHVYNRLAERIKAGNHLLRVDLNAAYAIRIICRCQHPEVDEILVSLYSSSSSPLIRRDVIYAMSRRKAFYWVSDAINEFVGASPWERRAFILASYVMKDAGQHWRKHLSSHFTPFEVLMRDWVASKNPSASGWVAPL